MISPTRGARWHNRFDDASQELETLKKDLAMENTTLKRELTMVNMVRLLSVIGAVSGSGLCGAESNAKDATYVPTDSFEMWDDLEVSVWAQSPLLNNPTNMDIDAKGRIWVAEGVNYRVQNLRPDGDRIMVLEDSTGDGKADKSHVFVQDKELRSPLGIAVIGNQILVAQPPNMILYTDVDGDAKFDPEIDKRENFLTGFNGYNHDHSLHSLTVGPGGQWYFNIGNTGGGHIADKSGRSFTIGSWYNKLGKYSGKRSSDGHVYVGGTAFRINPDGTQMNVIATNQRNSYEQSVDSFGDVYCNDNDGQKPHCRTTWLMEYGSLGYSSRDGLTKWQVQLRPGQSTTVGHWRQEDPGVIPSGDVYGFGSPTGIVVYENGALPKKHRGMLLSCEPGNNVIYGYYPKIKGAGYTLKNFDFMVTNVPKRAAGDDRNSHVKRGQAGAYDSRAVDTMFRPSDVAVGPDGAIYVTDWFDVRLSGHATFDPGLSGTIYRIAPKGFKSVIPSLDLKTVSGQVEALRNPACNVRALGLYALEKSGAKAIPEVKKLLEDENSYMHGRGIWALSKLGPEGLKEVEAIFHSDSDTLRLVAFRALRRANHRLLEHANTLASDSSIRVRREVALAMRDLPFENAGPVLLKLATGYTEDDRWNLEAFGTGCSGKEEAVYTALRKEQGASPLEWSARFSDIAWRLHPESALEDFKVRALSEAIDVKERSRCLTAIAFMKSEKAALTMLALSRAAPPETRVMASWWLFHPEQSIWRTYEEIAKVIKPKPVTQDYLIPKIMGTAIKGLTKEKVLALQGDVKRGKAVAARCYVCHKIEDAGALFGPDITGFAQSRSVEVTVSDILDPDVSISRGFEGTRVMMKNGKVIEGLLQSVTPQTMQLITIGGGSLTVARKEVKSYKKVNESMMVSAANMGMSAQDVSDVVTYLKSIELK